MSLIGMIIFLAIVGAILALIPMDVRIRNAIVVITIIAVVLWICQLAGLLSGTGLYLHR